MAALTYDVAIIGMGFSGTAVAVELLKRLPDGAKVLLAGTPGATARGVAYGTDRDDFLLNVRAERMGVCESDPLGFARWLTADRAARGVRAASHTADEYAPRRDYGRYLQDALERALAVARCRLDVDITSGTAVDVQAAGAGYSVRMASGERHAVRAVALCPGNGPMATPYGDGEIDRAIGGRVIQEPYVELKLVEVGVDDHVLLIGTGLSMVDQVLALTAAGHRGPLTAVSRRGLLPAAQPARRLAPKSPQLEVTRPSLRGLVRKVRTAVDAHQANGGDWRQVIDGLRPETQRLWSELSLADRQRFHRHIAAFWLVHRQRMAPAIAERIQALRDEGRLRVVAGRVRAVGTAARGVTVSLRPRSHTEPYEMRADWVINCAGSDWTRPDRLLANLYRTGLARPHPVGRGIDVGGDGRLVTRGGKLASALYAVGPITGGAWLEVTAVPEIRAQAASIAAAMVAGATTSADERRSPRLTRSLTRPAVFGVQ